MQFRDITFTENHTNSRDRSSWGRGAWDNEPSDKLVWVDKRTNLDCMMVRNHSGAWCGYVAVKPGHFLFGVNYTDLGWGTVTVHGGLTYSDSCKGHICHGTEDEDHVHWFGFDCNHRCDKSPSGTDGGLGVVLFGNGTGDGYRTQGYVIKEVTSLAKQIAALTEEDLREAKEDLDV